MLKQKLELVLQSRFLLVLTVPLSVLYGFIVYVRNLLFDMNIFRVHHSSLPVISVGNISAGGTGKTILVQSLAEVLLLQKKRPAILSRGYGRKTSGLQIVSDESRVVGDLDNAGDEPLLLAMNLPGVPVVVSENRAMGVLYIEDNFSVDMILLDDAFQHRSLHRDLDIVLRDRSGSVRERLLPWGHLREDLRSLERADIILESKSDTVGKKDYDFIILPNDHLSYLNNKQVSFEAVNNGFGVFSGLGNNAHFFKTVEDTIGTATLVFPLPDHCDYGPSDIARIPLRDCPAWITTQKDFIKLSPEICERYNIYYLGVRGVIPPALNDRLKQYFK
jgi:tetraacyldisaccharide 4'-kinase